MTNKGSLGLLKINNGDYYNPDNSWSLQEGQEVSRARKGIYVKPIGSTDRAYGGVIISRELGVWQIDWTKFLAQIVTIQEKAELRQYPSP